MIVMQFDDVSFGSQEYLSLMHQTRHVDHPAKKLFLLVCMKSYNFGIVLCCSCKDLLSHVA